MNCLRIILSKRIVSLINKRYEAKTQNEKDCCLIEINKIVDILK